MARRCTISPSVARRRLKFHLAVAICTKRNTAQAGDIQFPIASRAAHVDAKKKEDNCIAVGSRILDQENFHHRVRARAREITSARSRGNVFSQFKLMPRHFDVTLTLPLFPNERGRLVVFAFKCTVIVFHPPR